MGWAAPNPGLREHLLEAIAAPSFPTVRLVQQTGEHVRIVDADAAARHTLQEFLESTGPHGGPIAVAVGSRGIHRLAELVAVTIDELRGAGYDPFVVPAMGSHGGATTEGQLEVLAGYGISENTLGVPLKATMETVVVGEVDGHPVHVDRHVVEAGRVFLVNRVKPHTDFRGPIESGAAKMAAIGLGNRSGAAQMHALGPSGLRDVMPLVARAVAEHFVLGALVVVENALGDLADVTALTASDIAGPREMALLELARSHLPRLPFGRLDVLVIDRIGKDVSGTCLDPNVVQRWMVGGVAEPDPPLARILVGRSLTPASKGNALGVGLLDFVTKELAEEVDLVKTYVNGMTAGWSALERTRLPIVLETDREAIEAALVTCGRQPDEAVRLLWITDTLHVQTVAASAALWDEAKEGGALAFLGDPFEMPFDSGGALPRLQDVVAFPSGRAVGAA